MQQRRICVSVVTRSRPKMLCNLFSSLASIKKPDNASITFLIVENNASPTLDETIEGFRAQMREDQIDYIIEGVLGISSARNRALNHAIEHGFDFLVYVDDDEFVEPDWLITLLAERDRLDLDIIGSPVRPKPFDEKLTFLQKLVWSGIERSGYKSERKCRRKCQLGRADSIKVATGSWMGKLEFFRNTGLRFDSHFGLTGGEDWNLWAKAKSLGARTGWACDAIVYETVPSSRLTLSYHYRRNRDHNITEFGARYRENPNKTLKKLPLKIAGRALKFLGTVLSIPFRGGQGLVSSATALGGLVGLVQGCIGKNSLHYANTTGF
ncbi:glycosyltransferase family 2 protein [Brucella pituitosa]|uniref:Glycosyltransferase family 2 protein n=2 Tax=Brucella pituitosa TaxID=571256 RepID=A0A643F4Z2_9HYPH|nr:glycosyltransferase [Brucella pituitosa]KAB0573212.1 glycosyltransferase family 2 protein [Brucella pituitosa]PRA56613.1 glycosyl transferase family A [Ochrobactrum sp. MYb68]